MDFINDRISALTYSCRRSVIVIKIMLAIEECGAYGHCLYPFIISE